MRIAFVHPRFPSAEGTGATHSATQIVTGLADAGHEVCVYCTRSPDESVEQTEMELRHLSGNSSHPHTSTRLNKEIIARRDELREFDIVHSYLTPLIPSIARIGKDSDVGTVVTLNAYGGTCAKNDLLYLDREQCQSKSTLKCLNCISRTGFGGDDNGYLYQTTSQLFSLRLVNAGESRLEYIDGFRAPSGHVRDNYVRFGYDLNKIETIPHPVDEQFLVPHESDFAEPYRILYVGSLAHHKGVQKLVPLVAALNTSGTQFELTVVGTGGLEEQMRSQAENYGVEHLIDFRGFVPNADLPAVYASHDCFIHPGIWEEPLARVYLEALATGTPIVTSEYGTIDEIVGDAGRLTDGSVEEFRDVLLEITKSGEMAGMSEATSKQVTQFNRSRIIEEIENLYAGATA
ncbi:Glycosyltransferase involved in cell wall bisynthesis [Halobiforma haloterrestris]|uniref:Glycosyltransferase involved in cell wall bisynthesis n=1 Tax=Natronobacterium haloterrestre TaxID=148448 RepID=A0A1I1LQT6_NATHA|nr:glycosyltransferase family 4 protein [Halobiforma haloterrestris]SFC75597.1 Glycosyltransferase involved in cell wall bisynthesis [Halobiforma haloterrestris]